MNKQTNMSANITTPTCTEIKLNINTSITIAHRGKTIITQEHHVLSMIT